MDARRFQELDQFYARAVTAPADERDRILAEASALDAEVGRELERLLAVEPANALLGVLVEKAGASLLAGRSGPERPAEAPAPSAVELPDASSGRAEIGVELPDAIGPSRSPAAEMLEHLAARAPRESRYRIDGEVARGGMGAILRAFDPDLRRVLAMKVALEPSAPLTDERQRARTGRFLEEAQITGQLDHPGIVPVHEIGLDAHGRLYFTMRLVGGHDLGTIYDLARKGEEGWSTTRVLGVLLKVCEAVAYAHSKGVIHRDLKPENVMVGRFGEVYVMDWGVAKVLGQEDTRDLRIRPPTSGGGSPGSTGCSEDPAGDQDPPLLTMDGTVIGTPSYMAPEQATGRIEELDARSDVYAVGACLYTLLTGWQPYVKPGTRTSSLRILNLVREGPPKPVYEMDRTIPMELVAICEKAMAREKSERYASMQELAEELRAYLGDRVVKAHRTGAFAELTKWVRRNRGMAAAIAAACLVAILGAVVSGIYARRATQSLDRFLQLADVVTLRELVAEADTLWPEVPEKVNAMADWLRRASELSLHRPQLEQALVDLRHRARALTATELEEARRRHPKAQELSESRKRLLQAEQNLPLPRDNEQEDLTEDDRLHGRALRAEVDRLKAAIAAMEGEIEATLRPRHAETGDQILYDTLERLVRDLRDLEDPELGVIASVVKRHTWASTVHQQTVVAENTAWREAIASIGNEAACPVYGGHKLKPQVGLVPLGRDRASGLWEFWHPRTGARPQRDEAGRYVVGDETGLLFVLIPGGTFWMGAQNRDAGARNHDPNAGREESPVHEVRLAPYFLAKYEMTQGQWGRVMGHYPSYYRLGTTMREHPVTLRNPVEHVDFDECAEIAQRLGLVLPTEAQWEHACRAGTDTVWHTGGTVESLSGSANLADEGSKGSYPAGWRYEPGFDDGHGVHAPVGSFLPNGFGLYDMHGNVWEWCRDEYGDYRTPPQREDGARVGDGSGMHVSRGGSFYFPASNARSAYRSRDLASRRGLHLGCRPAARVTP